MNFQWMSDFGPEWGIGLVIAGYVVTLVWVFSRPAATMMRGAPDQRAWRDLRLWILPIVLIQVWLYWVLR
jgi:hypothetical protein